MANFETKIKSISGYIGTLPTEATNFSGVKQNYIDWLTLGGAQFDGVFQYNTTNYFSAEFTPHWLTTQSIDAGFTPLYSLQLSNDAGGMDRCVTLGLQNGGALAFWFANTITPQIPIPYRFEWEGGRVSEGSMIAAYNPFGTVFTAYYDVWVDGDYIYMFGVPSNAVWDHWAGNYWLYTSCVVRVNIPNLINILKYEVNIFSTNKPTGISGEKFSPDYGTPSVPEGYGTGTGGSFDDSSDTIAIPSAPAMGITNAGFVNIYKITSNALQQFGSELFPDFSFTPISQLPAVTDVQSAVEVVAQVLVDFGNQIPAMIDMYINNTLINYILDCHIIPVNPLTNGTANIKVGFKTFTPSAGIVTSDYVDFDCGSLNIAEYYANFIDYAPYTTAKLFLPFVGFVEVLPEFWQAGTINITYRFNIIDGSFMAFISSTSSKSKLTNSVIAQYGGNCCVHIPITGANYSNMVTGLIGAAAGVVAGGAGVASIAGGAASALNTVATRSGMQNSNGYNSTTAFLGIRKPYLLIERTIADFSETYDTERGIPANITAKLSTVSGFTTSSAIHLDNITGATSAELDEIASLLAGGVIL